MELAGFLLFVYPFFPLVHGLTDFPVSVSSFHLRNPALLDLFPVGIKIANLFRNYLFEITLFR